MRKLILTTFAIAFISVALNAQYYYLTGGGANPGGNINQDPEYPGGGGGMASGWTTIDPGSAATPVWSTVQTLPFAFKFNGNAVTQYKVSTSGILTFNTGTTLSAPSYTKAALPNATIPDMSVCIWGLSGLGSNDVIVYKLFGTAPNRQLWIQFNSYSYGTTASDGSNFCYWSIMLEETSNLIYIVDQRTGGYTGTSVVSAGIQVNSTSAYSVTGSPNLATTAGINATPVDNNFYQFINGIQPQYGIKCITNKTSNTAASLPNNPNGTPIVIQIWNVGVVYFGGAVLNYQVNSLPVQRDTISLGTAINSGLKGIISTQNYNFKPSTSLEGQTSYIKAWLSNINSVAGKYSDTISFSIWVNKGITGTKRVLLEEGTGAWCGFCPDGHLKMRDILAANGDKVIGLVHHNSDSMAYTESEILNTTYAFGYPYGMVDRNLFNDQKGVAISRTDWVAKVTSQLAQATPINVSIINKTFNTTTRSIGFDVKGDFVDYPAPGEIRLSVWIAEDKVRGAASGTSTNFTQHSYYSSADAGAGGSSHELYNQPAYFYGYLHNHVATYVANGAWGNVYNIPQVAIAPGSTFTKHFTYTLPTQVNVTDNIDFSGNTGLATAFQNTYSGDARNKPNEIKIVAFISYFNIADPNQRQVLNAIETPLTHPTAVEKPIANNTHISGVTPNPTNSITRVDFNVTTTSRATVEIVNIVGQNVMTVTEGTYAAGEHSAVFDATDLNNGIYFVTVKTNEGNSTQKFVVTK